MNDITPWAKLIEAMGATMRNSDYASDIDQKIDQIQQACAQIRRIIETRRGGER